MLRFSVLIFSLVAHKKKAAIAGWHHTSAAAAAVVVGFATTKKVKGTMRVEFVVPTDTPSLHYKHTARSNMNLSIHTSQNAVNMKNFFIIFFFARLVLCSLMFALLYLFLGV